MVCYNILHVDFIINDDFTVTNKHGKSIAKEQTKQLMEECEDILLYSSASSRSNNEYHATRALLNDYSNCLLKQVTRKTKELEEEHHHQQRTNVKLAKHFNDQYACLPNNNTDKTVYSTYPIYSRIWTYNKPISDTGGNDGKKKEQQQRLQQHEQVKYQFGILHEHDLFNPQTGMSWIVQFENFITRDECQVLNEEIATKTHHGVVDEDLSSRSNEVIRIPWERINDEESLAASTTETSEAMKKKKKILTGMTHKMYSMARGIMNLPNLPMPRTPTVDDNNNIKKRNHSILNYHITEPYYNYSDEKSSSDSSLALLDDDNVASRTTTCTDESMTNRQQECRAVGGTAMMTNSTSADPSSLLRTSTATSKPLLSTKFVVDDPKRIGTLFLFCPTPQDAESNITGDDGGSGALRFPYADVHVNPKPYLAVFATHPIGEQYSGSKGPGFSKEYHFCPNAHIYTHEFYSS